MNEQFICQIKASPHLFDLSQQFDGVCVSRRIVL